ncbi:MAG: hypothetical protein K2X63_03430 [Burkholderiaceae bacterium]|nr:hypothetical protein [Burkholderiaceae bacterium]
MKDRIEKLSQLALQSASSAGRGLLNVQTMAQDLTQTVSQTVSKEAVNRANAATSFALAAGKSMQQSLTHVIEHETTQALMEQVKETSQHLTDSATHGAKFVGNQVIDGVKKIDNKLEENHLEIKEKTETVSMGLGIAAGVAAGAAIIGPPIVVAAAPVIGVAATVTGAVAGTAYFYSKWKTKKVLADVKNDAESELVDAKDVPQKR